MADARRHEETLRHVDDEARRLARRLVRTARHGSLAVNEPGTGFPSASRISVAADFEGRPLLLVSDLSLHTGALRADGRCALLLGEPGAGDPLATPRITLTGRARFLDRETPEGVAARSRFLERHEAAALYADFGDFHFVRIEPERAALNGGFAKAYALEAADVVDPDGAALAERAERARLHMNDDHLDSVDAIVGRLVAEAGSGWHIATVDRRGFEVRRGERIERVEFGAPVAAPEDYRQAFVALARGG